MPGGGRRSPREAGGEERTDEGIDEVYGGEGDDTVCGNGDDDAWISGDAGYDICAESNDTNFDHGSCNDARVSCP